MTIHSDPGKYGLTLIGEVDFSSGNYEFNYTAVWRAADGTFRYGDDSGCSCPAPFQDTSVNDLAVCTPAELQAHLEQRAKTALHDHSDGSDRWAMQIANLMARVTSPELHDTHAVGDEPEPVSAADYDAAIATIMERPSDSPLSLYEVQQLTRVLTAGRRLAGARLAPADAIVLPADRHEAIDAVFGHYSGVVDIQVGPIVAERCESVMDPDCIRVLAAGSGVVEPGAAVIHMDRRSALYLLRQLAEAADAIVLERPTADAVLTDEDEPATLTVTTADGLVYILATEPWGGKEATFLTPAWARTYAALIALAADEAERGQG